MSGEITLSASAKNAECVKITGRFDPEVIDWLNGGGTGFENQLNIVLRDFMEKSSKKDV